MADCILTVVSGGSWNFKGNGWTYVGKHVSSALIIRENVAFKDLVKLIRTKLDVGGEAKLKLGYYTSHPTLIPPIDISSDEDLEIYKFVNCGAKVLQTPLYCTVDKLDDDVTPHVITKTEEIEVLSSAPMEDTQTMAGEVPSSGRKRKNDNEWWSNKVPKSIYDDAINLSCDEEKDHCLGGQQFDSVYLSDDEDGVGGPSVDLTKEHRNCQDISSEDDDLYLSDDSYRGWDTFLENALGKGRTTGSDAAGPSSNTIIINDEDGEDVEDDDEYGAEFLKEVDECELRTLKSHHSYSEAVVEDAVVACDQLVVGAVYESKEVVKNLLAEHALENYFETRVRRSEPSRLFVRCKNEGCTFKMNACSVIKTKKYVVKKFETEHSCGMKCGTILCSQAIASFLARNVIQGYDLGKKVITPSEIKKALKLNGLDVNYSKARRARKLAETMIRGTHEESFSYIYSWLEMLKVVNPGSYIAFKKDSEDRYEACFWALGCTINAFPHLRKVVPVDGAHLSGKYDGILFMATRQDPNNQVYPIAFSVVGSESNKSWSFFFQHLKASGAVPDRVDTVVISDRHVSISKCLRMHYKLCGYGICAYHLYHNLRTRGGGQAIQDQWFRVAKAYTVEDFEKEMNDLKVMAPSMADRAMKVRVETWSRAHCLHDRYNIMTTNTSECLNSVFKAERGWHVIPLFKAILQKMSIWFNERRIEAGAVDDKPTQKPAKIMDRRHMAGLKLGVIKVSKNVASVSEGGTEFEVDLRLRTCSCKVFQKDKIPCRHAMADAASMNVNPTDMLSPLYKNIKYKELYKQEIRVVPKNRAQWTVHVQVHCNPPIWKRGPGRPRVHRYKAAWERIRCTNCRKYGHLSSRCYSRS